MQYHRQAAVLLLSSVLLSSLLLAGTIPVSFAADKVEGGQHVPNNNDITIESVSIFATASGGPIVIEIVQDGNVIGFAKVDEEDISSKNVRQLTAEFDPLVEVDDDFDIVVRGNQIISLKKDEDKTSNTPGHYFDDLEMKRYDLRVLINGTSLVNLKTVLGVSGSTSTSGTTSGGSNPPASGGSNPPASGGTASISIVAKRSEDGTTVISPGMHFTVRDPSNLEVIGQSFTSGAPVVVQAGKPYDIYATFGFQDIRFVEWADNAADKDNNLRTETVTGAKTFTALYSGAPETSTSGEPPGGEEQPPGDNTTTTPPPIEEPAAGGPNTVTVQSKLLDGTTVTGMLAQLRDSGGDNVQEDFTTAELTLEDGQNYRVIMYSFGEDFFRKWSNGHLHRYFPVEGDGSAYTLTALYEHVPEAQQAKLEVRAKTSDGQPIGGTTGRAEDGTLQALPGVEVQIAPPGSFTPFTAYTAGFSGGSEIEEQFYFIKGQTYVVAMQSFGELQFSHWEDNGSENSARAVPLSGDVTLTAIYNVVP
jgi:hypothetical protein